MEEPKIQISSQFSRKITIYLNFRAILAFLGPFWRFFTKRFGRFEPLLTPQWLAASEFGLFHGHFWAPETTQGDPLHRAANILGINPAEKRDFRFWYLRIFRVFVGKTASLGF